jgi:RND family efflux transporter MFP subunit
MIATDEQKRLNYRRGSRTRTLFLGVIIFGVLIALIVGGVLPRLQSRSKLTAEVKARESDEPIVSTVVLKSSGSTAEVSLPASMQAIQEAPIYARVSGYLKSRGADIGDRVKAGALLAEIEAPEIEQQLAQAKANVARAEATLAQAKANQTQTESRQVYAKVTLDRWTTLVNKGVLAKQEGDERKSGFDAATADVEAAKSNVKAAEADIVAQQANMRRLEEMHRFQRVVAPFDGVITARNVDPGTLITAGSNTDTHELFRIAKTDQLRIFVNVPQTYSASIHPGGAASVRVNELPGRSFPGKIIRTSDALDPNSRTLLTEIHIPNLERALRPGMFASVRFSLDRSTPSLLVPAAVLAFRSDGPHIALLENGNKVHYVKVTPGRDFGADMEVLAGAKAGDRAILNPSDDLAEGTRVQAENGK